LTVGDRNEFISPNQTHQLPKCACGQNSTRIKRRRGTLCDNQNGKPTMVVQSVHEYEHTQVTLAMFKMLAQGERVIAHGSTIPADGVITKHRKRHSL
jgi:hypothetical protein